MVRGILSGLICGGVTGTVVVSVLSLYAPPPSEVSSPAMSQVEDQNAVEPSSSDGQASDGGALDVEPEEVVEPEPVELDPVEPEPVEQGNAESTEPVNPVEPEVVTVAPEVTPEIAQVEVEPAEPKADEEVKVAEAEAEAAVVVEEPVIEEPAPSALVDAPQGADNQIAGDDEAAVVATNDEVTPLGQVAQLGEDQAEAPVAALDTPETPAVPLTETAKPAAPATSDAPELATRSDATSPSNVTPESLLQPQADAAPSASGETAARIAAVADPKPDKTAQATPVSSDTPIKLPVPKIENPVAGVVTNRLPSVTAPEADVVEEAAVTEEEGVAPAIDPSEIGALAAYAAAVEGEVTDALFSVILIDDGGAGVSRAELIALDVPFSIAIDPVSPNAAEVAGQYRAAGIEVLAMLGDLPTSAEPSDVAIAVEGYFGVLNEAIAVLDPLDARIQSNRSLLQPVLGAIRETGHGLVTYDRGLNSAQQAARREGIAAGTVFRVLDGDDEEAPRIKRYLSRAAFNASKDGTVIVVGRNRPETVKALLEWALDEKGGELSIVPVSRVMQQDLG